MSIFSGVESQFHVFGVNRLGNLRIIRTPGKFREWLPARKGQYVADGTQQRLRICFTIPSFPTPIQGKQEALGGTSSRGGGLGKA